MRSLHICGTKGVHLAECSDCSGQSEAIKKLEECCKQVQDKLAKKLEMENIFAGDNITITSDGFGNIWISSTGGGGCSCTKAEILDCLGVREMEMIIDDTDGGTTGYYVLGRSKGEQIGNGSSIESCNCTKEQLLDILGYEEIDIVLSDDDVTRTWTLIGKPMNV